MVLTRAERDSLDQLVSTDVVSWMEEHFYIEDPRDPFTGERFPAGPIRLHPIQKRILRAALTKVDGKFPFSTIVFSTIKKSGKTRIGAGVATWYAATQGRYNEIYCLANDGKQSADRILSAVTKCVELNPNLGWRTTRTKIKLPNGTFVESIPCDPTGQAGSNPGLTVWSEMWGYRHEHKNRLWSEMTVPPTRHGEAFRWVESYAGYTDESTVLYDLFLQGTEGGVPHPDFPDMPVYVNPAAGLFCYWDQGLAARRMPWQTPEYYAEQERTLLRSEFRRIHKNEWVSSTQKAIPIEWWDECRRKIPPLDRRTPVVMSVDASVSGACTACMLVSRDPHPTRKKTHVLVRRLRVWTPPEGGKIDLETTVSATIQEWRKLYNIKELVYDEFQLHHLMTEWRKKQVLKMYSFSQMSERLKADKQIVDMVVAKRIGHDGNPVLRKHVDNAQAKAQENKLRFVAPDTTQKSGYGRRLARPIDALITLSMGTDRCLYLNLA